MGLISRDDLMNDLDTSIVFSGRTSETGGHNSEVVGAQKVINRIEAAPEVRAIPIDWIENYITMLTVSGHSDHEPELEETNAEKAKAIRGMLEYYELDKRISNLEEEINKIKSDLKGVNTFFNE